MTATAANSPPPAPLALGPEMTIAYAAECRITLANALAMTAGDLPLDLSAVTEVDSSALQLLLATRRSLRERGHRLRIVASSAVVRDAAGVLGLAALVDAGDARDAESASGHSFTPAHLASA